jgi:hypothetical protein
MVIIVGNGTSILDSKNGKSIDSFDDVVRFNSFRIKDYEEYTGKKTTIWFTCNSHHIRDINSFKSVYVHTWEWDKNKCQLFKSFYNLRNDCVKTDREFVRSKIPLPSPSTGLIAIYMMLEKFPKVTITGFDWWDREDHHYADNQIRGTLHKPKEELKLIKKFIDSNRVSFL